MRDKGLILAWALLFAAVASGVLYAEFAYNGGGDLRSGVTLSRGDGGQVSDVGDAAMTTAPTASQATGAGAAAASGSAAQTPAIDTVQPPPRVAFAAAAPIAGDMRPRIVLIMSEIGLSRARSREAIERLPPAVTIAVIAYADDRDSWVRDARAIGHEALIAAPMEPENYPLVDPGPDPLLIDMDDLENLARYDRALDGAAGVVGVLAHRGGRFLGDRDRLRPILASTQDRGLIFVDNRSSPTSAVASLAAELDLHVLLNDRFVDAEPSREAIQTRLGELEEIATRRGYAVGVATPYPVSIEQIRRWADSLGERGYVLAPVSAVARIPAP